MIRRRDNDGIGRAPLRDWTRAPAQTPGPTEMTGNVNVILFSSRAYCEEPRFNPTSRMGTCMAKTPRRSYGQSLEAGKGDMADGDERLPYCFVVWGPIFQPSAEGFRVHRGAVAPGRDGDKSFRVLALSRTCVELPSRNRGCSPHASSRFGIETDARNVGEFALREVHEEMTKGGSAWRWARARVGINVNKPALEAGLAD